MGFCAYKYMLLCTAFAYIVEGEVFLILFQEISFIITEFAEDAGFLMLVPHGEINYK